MSDQMLRAREACEALGIHRVTMYRWIKAGILPAIRLPGGEFRIRKEDIDLILTHGKLTAKKPKRRKMPPPLG